MLVRSQRASALLIVLWVLALLSFLIITTMMVATQDVESAVSRRLVSRAQQLAERGIALGAHPGVRADDSLLHGKISASESYDVRLTTEERRLNLNAQLTPERSEVLARLFTIWGLPEKDAQALTKALMEIADARRKSPSTGATAAAPFRKLDEIAAVKGMDAVAALRPSWRESFTLRGDGHLDVNEADAELIAAAADVPLSAARTFVEVRDGPDGIPQTKDDKPLENIEELPALLGTKMQNLAQIFTLHGGTQRIESTGRAGGIARCVTITLQKNAPVPLLEWQDSTPVK